MRKLVSTLPRSTNLDYNCNRMLDTSLDRSNQIAQWTSRVLESGIQGEKKKKQAFESVS